MCDVTTKIQELETYYTSRQWKDDFAMDEEGKFPKRLKKGVLSEDGIPHVKMERIVI